MRARVLAVAVALSACTQTKVDPNVTGIEIATDVAAADGITQLQLSGTIGTMAAFDPGVLPATPRPLSGPQTAVVLLPDSLDGASIFVRVDALAGATIVHTGGAMVTVTANQVAHAGVTLGPPAICGDGMIEAPFEKCDDNNMVAGDGCSASCQVENGWSCVGISPSICAPLSSKKEITSYAFLAIANPGLHQDVMATIEGTTISANVPFGTNINGLVATFATTGTTARVGGSTQVSGQTPNDFASPVGYLIVADDGTTKSYTASVHIASTSAKDIMTYAFLAANNPGLTADVIATINGTSIAATVPAGTNVSSLVATFATTGTNVTVGATAQSSGVTANSFAAPVAYTVTAADNSMKTYSVAVSVAAGSAKDLTAFVFKSANNPSLPADVVASINGTAIAATVPSGTDLTSLVATFATTGASVTVNGVVQTSGTTANNFTVDATYIVTAADLSTQTYTVTVTAAMSSSKSISSFAFLSANNPQLPADVIATINGTAITATVPSGTNVTALIATFATTGAKVSVGGTTQTSGITANNFTSAVGYLVTAADMSTQTYTVTVPIAASSAKDITSFMFTSAKNPGLGADVIATINGTTVTATVPNGTNVTALVATFATTGAKVSVGGTTQTSGITANNFTGNVVYTVTAADNSTKQYTVTVTIASTSANDMTAFAFLSANNTGLAADAIGTINGTAVSVTLPVGTDVTALVATFTVTGKFAKVSNKHQTSGQTANNFTNPVVYIVTASDNSTKQYTVTVTLQ